MAPAEKNRLALEGQVCFALSVASRSIVNTYREVLEPLNLTHPQYLVMLALWQYEPVSLTQLSQHLKQDSGTLSPLVKRLEGQGLLQRTRVAGDERTLSITLTEKGHNLRTQAEPIPDAIAERLGMSWDELEALHASMTKLIERSSTHGTDTKDSH
ncbi:MarR family transcriptional regulator [Klugiella xanthotipulae]|uniref:DNA-binding MarR family transcriptional regulator n=1 Tax=Klugiella xanthotipulae TaxID=244735 RepID=A0A543HY28_9MICO|nr:MarR family transcriptional regulator [Klugiella xanthotipulae]TQM63213.1 DNA-binding MarR family transcriptional regulator [Klugiella xanthotipulae]